MEAFQEELDDSLWTQLPSHLLEMIVLRLPLAKGMQFKILSKAWRDLLAQHSYYRRRFEIQVKRPWLLLCTSGEFSYALDFTLSVWHRIPNPPLYRQTILCTAGNVACLGNLVADCRALSVCDPNRKLIKRVPPMNRIRYIHKVGITFHTEDAGYKIMVAGEEELVYGASSKFRELLTEVYDSKANMWSMAGKTLPEAKFGMDAGVWLHNKFYCVVEIPYGVVVFDAEKGVWEEMEADMPASCAPNHFASPSLVECEGRLLMVVRASSDGIPNSRIQIWELVSKREQIWKKRKKEEWRILEEYIGEECMGSGRLVCCGVGERVCITTQSYSRPLAFKLARGTWEWLPLYPTFSLHTNNGVLAFSLDPISHYQALSQ